MLDKNYIKAKIAIKLLILKSRVENLGMEKGVLNTPLNIMFHRELIIVLLCLKKLFDINY